MDTIEKIRNRLECIKEELEIYDEYKDMDIVFNLNEEIDLLKKKLQVLIESEELI